MKYAYYPGCSAHSTARDMHESCLAVAKALDIELNEIKGWTCCGASAAHQTDRNLAVSLASANLLLAKEMGMDMVVNCAACYNRSKVANYEIKNSEEVKQSVADSLGEIYDGSVPVRHFVEILLKDIGPAKLRKKIINPLKDLKVAAYYGCYLVRPPEATNFDDPENPTILESLIDVTGGTSVSSNASSTFERAASGASSSMPRRRAASFTKILDSKPNGHCADGRPAFPLWLPRLR